MQSRLFFVSLTAMAAATSANATVYLTVEQAQAAMAPGAALQADFRTLTDAQVGAIKRETGEAPLSRQLKAWKVAGGGWFIVDQVVGKHEFIPFALTLDAQGAVKGVEILEYRETYGGQVREAAWRSQFQGKRNGAVLTLGKDIKNISGATLSSKHITDGVRRLLATYALVLAADPH